MTLGERIKKVRKEFNLTQQGFCEKIGLKRNSISLVESGKRNISDQAIKSICREFNVSETWLRTGEGEMFVQRSRDEALAAQIEAFLQGGTDSFRKRLVSLLIRLSPEQWDALEGYLLDQVALRAPSLDIDAELAAYRAELESQRESREVDSGGSTASAGFSDSGKRLA